MNKILSGTIFSAAILLAFSACTKEEIRGGVDAGAGLPDDAYVLKIGSVGVTAYSSIEEPWTKVTASDDNSAAVWENGDLLGVELVGATNPDGSQPYFTSTGQYQITVADGTVTDVTPVEGKEVYWTNSTPINETNGGSITAWYPVEDGQINLANQATDGFPHVLRGTAPILGYEYTHESSVSFNFLNQLTRIRVVLSQSVSSVTGVEIYGYTTCTSTKGEISISATDQQDWMAMKNVFSNLDPANSVAYYDACVVPGQIDLGSFIRVNGINVNIQSGSFPTKLKPGAVYTVNVMVF